MKAFFTNAAIRALSVVLLLAMAQVVYSQQQRPQQMQHHSKYLMKLTVTDNAPWHVHAPGAAWKVGVVASMSLALEESTVASAFPDPKLSYQWVDHTYEPLPGYEKQYIPLADIVAGKTVSIASPANPKTGWYGLRFVCDNPDVTLPDYHPNEPRTWGFAVMPLHTVEERKFSLLNNMGLTHNKINDPYISGIDKNMSGPGPNASQTAATARYNQGMWGMPLINKRPWANLRDREEDTKWEPTEQELKTLEDYAEEIASINHVRMWEFGLEENLLSGRYGSAAMTNYTNNVLPKLVEAVQKGFAKGNLVRTDGWKTQLCYQIAEPNGRRGDLTRLLESSAAKFIDVLSLHPYQWPNFPDSDIWLGDFMDFVHSEIKRTQNTHLEIWFTEVGVAEHGAYRDPSGDSTKDAYFGYKGTEWNTQGKLQNNGIPSRYYATNLTKLQASMYNKGVTGSSWYCYRDPGPARWYPEHWFGVVDYLSFPKPAYMAYHVAQERLMTNKPMGMFKVGKVVVSRYRSGTADEYVIWLEQDLVQDARQPNVDRKVDNRAWSWKNVNTIPQFVTWESLGIKGLPAGVINLLGAEIEGAKTATGVKVGVDPIYVTAAGFSPDENPQ